MIAYTFQIDPVLVLEGTREQHLIRQAALLIVDTERRKEEEKQQQRR